MARLWAIAVCVACLCSLLAFGQTQASANQPSRYIWWENAQIAAGKYDAFNRIIAQYRETTTATTPEVYWIAGEPITGESDRVTFVTFHDNMASVEKMMAAFDKVDEAITAKNANFSAQAAEAAPSSHWALAEYNKDLSLRPDLVPIANTTWWSTRLYTLKPGCQYEFNDVLKHVAETHKNLGDNDHWIAYQVRGGYPQPSVLLVTPLRSLGDLDQEPSSASKETFESTPMRQMIQKIGKECIEHVETSYSRVDPKLSRVSQPMIAANPDFWTIKEEAPVMATAKKGKPKKEAVVPAAMTEKQ